MGEQNITEWDHIGSGQELASAINRTIILVPQGGFWARCSVLIIASNENPSDGCVTSTK